MGGGTRNLVPMTAGDFEKEVKVIEAYWYSGVIRETPLRNIPTKFETIRTSIVDARQRTRNLVPMTAGDLEKEVKVNEPYWCLGVSNMNLKLKLEVNCAGSLDGMSHTILAMVK